MATVLTGQDLSLTIGGDAFDAQTISTTFTYTTTARFLRPSTGPCTRRSRSSTPST
jgi:hypothetical protein